MSVKTIDESVLTNIADSIRAKAGTSALLQPSSFATAIEQIKTGGTVTVPKRFVSVSPLMNWTWMGGHGIVLDVTPYKSFRVSAKAGYAGSSSGTMYLYAIHTYNNAPFTSLDQVNNYFVSATNSRLSANWAGYAPIESTKTKLATKTVSKQTVNTTSTVTVDCTDWTYVWLGVQFSSNATLCASQIQVSNLQLKD